MLRPSALTALVCGLLVILAAQTVMAQEAAPATGDTPAAVQPEASEDASSDSGSSQGFVDRLREFWESDGVVIAKQIGLALGLFILGWIIAKLIAWMIYRVLLRTSVDDKLAEKLGLGMLIDDEDDKRVERVTAKIVYYLLMLLVVVGVLQYSGLTEAARPIQNFVNRIAEALPLVGKAVLILLAAYFGGLILQKIVSTAIDKARLDARFAELTEKEGEKEEGEEKEQRPFSQAAGRVVFWLIMVAGLAGAVDALEIGPLADSMRNAVDRIVTLLPSIAIAAALVILGYIFGRIARTVIDNVLDSAGFNDLIARIKLDKLFGEMRASDIVGLLAMVFIVLQATIAALDELGLETLSGPLTEMMAQFWNFLPVLAVSVLIVAAGIIGGKLVRNIVESALANMGFDDYMAKIGFGPLEEKEGRPSKPHEIVGLVVQVGIILVATVQALENVELETWSAYVNDFIQYSVTHVAIALIIIAVGLALGNYVRDLVLMRQRDEDDETVSYIGTFARYVVIVFAFTMAIHHLDIGPNFVLITFSLLFGSLCLALALALGLGSREVAGDIVKRQYGRARRELDARAKASPSKSTPGAPKPPTS